ncbi:MAG: hypothetical protein ACTSYL_03900 [Candidatus Thorarchaeota archaeon]
MGEDVISESDWTEEKLDEIRAREIITEIFQKAGETPPSTIEFIRKTEAHSKPKIHLDGGVLQVVASTEYELKRLVGRFILRRKWPLIKWFLVNHGRLFIIINFVLLGAILKIATLVAQEIPILQTEIITWSVILTTLLIQIIICIGPLEQSRLKRKLAIDMRHIEGLTEYDGHAFKIDQVTLMITFLIPISWVIAVLAIVENTISHSDPIYDVVIVIPLVLVFVGIIMWICTSMFSSRTDLCFGRKRDDAKTGTRYHTSEYLETSFTQIIDKLELRERLFSEFGEFDTIHVRFRNIKYPQCRNIYFYVSKRTLMVKASDISEEAARRYGVAMLISYVVETDADKILSQRSRPLFNFMFVLSMLLAIIIIKYAISQDAVVITSIFTAVIFVRSWITEWRQNNEVREEMAMALKRTDLFSEEAAKFYTKMVKIFSVRFDVSILIGSLFILFGLVWFLNVTNGG